MKQALLSHCPFFWPVDFLLLPPAGGSGFFRRESLAFSFPVPVRLSTPTAVLCRSDGFVVILSSLSLCEGLLEYKPQEEVLELHVLSRGPG